MTKKWDLNLTERIARARVIEAIPGSVMVAGVLAVVTHGLWWYFNGRFVIAQVSGEWLVIGIVGAIGGVGALTARSVVVIAARRARHARSVGQCPFCSYTRPPGDGVKCPECGRFSSEFDSRPGPTAVGTPCSWVFLVCMCAWSSYGIVGGILGFHGLGSTYALRDTVIVERNKGGTADVPFLFAKYDTAVVTWFGARQYAYGRDRVRRLYVSPESVEVWLDGRACRNRIPITDHGLVDIGLGESDQSWWLGLDSVSPTTRKMVTTALAGAAEHLDLRAGSLESSVLGYLQDWPGPRTNGAGRSPQWELPDRECWRLRLLAVAGGSLGLFIAVMAMRAADRFKQRRAWRVVNSPPSTESADGGDIRTSL